MKEDQVSSPLIPHPSSLIPHPSSLGGSMDRVTPPFSFSSTADEVLHGIDLKGKHAIVTGGTSGIGVDTAQALAKAGAAVTLAVRNVDAGKVVAQRITQATRNQEVFVRLLDLADQQSIAAFVASWEGRLH